MQTQANVGERRTVVEPAQSRRAEALADLPRIGLPCFAAPVRAVPGVITARSVRKVML
jgi:hypothetical protein